jgi:hypothetical protein
MQVHHGHSTPIEKSSIENRKVNCSKRRNDVKMQCDNLITPKK